MCGRFALYADEAEIVAHFQLKSGFIMRPRYNIAPSQMIPVITTLGKQIEFCRWGFVPYWAKDEVMAKTGHINARSETLAEKPTFKDAFKNHRCLIPASGYFEWRLIAGKKQPYYISIKETTLFSFAGIWSTWQAPNGESQTTCAIITAPATGVLQKVHDRMPILIHAEYYEKWLSSKTPLSEIKDLLSQQKSPEFMIHPVSKSMGDPKIEGMSCIRAL
jgi:putative SOS response-associated peptidase YedK